MVYNLVSRKALIYKEGISYSKYVGCSANQFS
jgi:hypothetical protein